MLAKLLKTSGLSQRELAGELGISVAAVNQLVTKHRWPVKNRQRVKDTLAKYLSSRGLPMATVQAAITSTNQNPDQTQEEPIMLRKQTFFPETRRAFNITRDPFSDVTTAEEVYLSPNIRFVRETMYQTAKHGGLLAVIGESGSGKSTLREDLLTRLSDDPTVRIIEPFVLGMEDNDLNGKTMKAMHIVEAIQAVVAPAQRLKRGAEIRFRQIHKMLTDSYKAGNRHVLIIEEAHDLSKYMLKHLKRFYEMKHGFNRLLAIILLGQTELAHKLDQSSSEVREVVQRTEVVHVKGLEDLHGYVAYRCKAAGLEPSRLFAPDALDSVILKLSGTKNKAEGIYPLAVNNLLIAALNAAHALGENIVTRDVIIAC